ncbi:uncharacterized protein CDV56_103696 [Aspergillus thermomutatus]|uniref:Uncharacterized protein n=1 Tax=Aspergillus thermomutatus TaxID=41047 RepID=A0A397GCG7_ASPTH|nr:uncharacterized protein CDV56_103696 [Aspergillus thermomutatus]RHZ47799.1 hypothetical protein CDV56_103696 [Aspergillus thermomutatus]
MNPPKPSEEAAPAYHELFDTDSINQPTATSSRTHQYAAVTQADRDENLNIASHHDVESHPQDSSNPLSQLDTTKPHFHCETCDRQLERRERKEKERECCQMVAVVFIVAIVCLTLLGIVIARSHEQQTEVQPQQDVQTQQPIKKGEREKFEDYVGEERKLMQEGDTYSGLIAVEKKQFQILKMPVIDRCKWRYAYQLDKLGITPDYYRIGVANLLGPVYPAPRDLSSNSSRVAAGWENLTATLHRETSSDSSLLSNLTFSVGLFSIHDPEAETLQFHYTSSEIQNAPNGTKKVDGDSIYRVASLSKLFTVFAAMLELDSEQWERPLTEIIPSFAEYVKSRSDVDSVYYTPWDQITPSALAAQISGVARDVLPWDGGDLLLQYAIAILAGLNPVPAVLDPATYGLPPFDQNDIPLLSPCLANGSVPCTGSLYAAGAANDAPVYLPWTSPGYSNNGFILLGLALANLTGKSLDEIYKQSIFDPLDMHSSYSAVPGASELSRSVIAGDFASGFGYDGGISKSSGGIYSTTNDLAKFGTAILNSTLLPPVDTRRWMKPVSHTADLQYSVGRPWEIYRYTHAKSGVVTDLYTKLGDAGNYGSFLVLVPDFNAGFSIIGASALATRSDATNLLADLVTEAILPALMEQAASEARRNFAGEYTSDRLNSSLALAVSSPGENPGLSVSSWVSNGTDLMPLVGTLLGNENSRLVPTIVSEGAREVAFRAYTVTQQKSGGLFQRNFDVNDWLVVGSGGYASKSLGQFVFEVDEQGKATKVELPAWNVTLHR